VSEESARAEDAGELRRKLLAGCGTDMFGEWSLGARPHLYPLVRGFDQFYRFLVGADSFFPAPAD
jgi:hypothetical protein